MVIKHILNSSLSSQISIVSKQNLFEIGNNGLWDL